MPNYSLSEKIANHIKKDINSFSLVPGSPLIEVELSEMFNASRTPVREALFRLRAEGLVDIIPGRGATVGKISVREVLEAYEIREQLEPFAVIKATLNGLNRKETQAIAKSLAELSNDPHTLEEFSEREEIDSDLHVLIAEAAKNELLTKIITDMRSKISRVFVHIGGHGRFQAAKQEHKAILEAIIAGDGDEAAELMKWHVQKSKARLLELSPPLKNKADKT